MGRRRLAGLRENWDTASRYARDSDQNKQATSRSRLVTECVCFPPVAYDLPWQS